MLTSADLNARGYLLWVHTSREEVSLYNIVNGEVVDPPDGLIDVTPYTLRDINGNIALPQNGDTMSVVMDWSSISENKFDVFINGLPATDRALYDPVKRYNSSVKYSGLMLGRIYSTGDNNNIDAFITQSEFTGGYVIETISGMNQTGLVGTTLSDSIKYLFEKI